MAAVADFKTPDGHAGSRHGNDFAIVLSVQHRIVETYEGQSFVNRQIAFGVGACVDKNRVASPGFFYSRVNSWIGLVGADMELGSGEVGGKKQ